MISFPLLRRVRVENYELYPGPNRDGLMDIQLGQGPWLILGVNGLGKSTLLLLMRNLMAGNARVRPAGFGGERNDVQLVGERFFAVRVGDDARSALGTLEVQFGDRTLVVTRRLSNLGLVSALIRGPDGQVEDVVGEEAYRKRLAWLMNLETFEDALRIIEHIVFFLEQRRPLIWDEAAQFEIFRALLMPDKSPELRALEGRIVSADSSARNLSAIIYKITQDRDREAHRQKSQTEVRARLAALRASINELELNERDVRQALDDYEEELDNARLQLKRADREFVNATQDYEHLKFETLRSAFATVAPTEQYLFLKLLSDRVCFACGQPAEETAAQILARIDAGACPVCGSAHAAPAGVPMPDDWQGRAAEAYAKIEKTRTELSENQKTFEDRSGRAGQTRGRLIEIGRQIEQAKLDHHKLSRSLPAGDADRLAKEDSRINALMEQMREFQAQRATAEAEIQVLLSNLKEKTQQFAGQLQARFDEIAKPFFAERVRLVYASRDTRIGQGGKAFALPAFEVEMTSGATYGDYVRRKQEQVSLSQRDYLDVIFRMVLLDVLGEGAGSLVVDGPEGSVDAVFAERAGELFALFASGPNVNAILACNIVEGDFIPRTLGNYEGALKRTHIINLLDQAVPTAALLELDPLYKAKIEKILGEGP